MSDLRFPLKIKAGLTFQHQLNLTAYPASNWALTTYLRGPIAIDISAASDGNLHLFNIAADKTKNWRAGHYGYSIRATHKESGQVDEIESGALEIIADLALVSESIEVRSHAKKTLAALEAVIEGRASLDQERYRINNRELYRTPLSELIKLRNLYRNEVSQELAKAKGKSLFGTVIRVKLG